MSIVWWIVKAYLLLGLAYAILNSLWMAHAKKMRPIQYVISPPLAIVLWGPLLIAYYTNRQFREGVDYDYNTMPDKEDDE